MSFTTRTAYDFNGVLDMLVDYVTGEDVVGEVLATPDGVVTDFSGTLANAKVHQHQAAFIYGFTASPAVANDTFTTLDPVRWTEDLGTGGTATADGSLHLSLAAGGTADTVSLESNFRLFDDCEVSVDFSNLAGLVDDLDGVGLRLSVGDVDYVYVYAGVYGGGKFFSRSNYNGTESNLYSSDRVEAFGSLKLVRENNLVTAYAKDGAGEYSLLATHPLRFGREVTVELDLHRAFAAGVSTELNNLTTTGLDLWDGQHAAYADVDGVITGTQVVSGSLSKVGEWTISLDTPPAVGVVFATNYKEQVTDPDRGDWSIRHWDVARNASNAVGGWGEECRACVLHSTGISGTENILVGIREWKDPLLNKWGWSLNLYYLDPVDQWHRNLAAMGLEHYDTSTEDTFDKVPIVPLADGITNIWLYVNKQRIVAVHKVAGGVYSSAYLGFGYRLDPPSSYPQPGLAIGGRYDLTAYTTEPYPPHRPYSSTVAGSYFTLHPRVQGAYKYDDLFMIPQQADTTIDNMTTTYDGLIMIWPIYIKRTPDTDQLLMQVDDVFVARGQGLSPESTFIQGGDTYRVFCGGNNTAVYNFFAVREV